MTVNKSSQTRLAAFRAVSTAVQLAPVLLVTQRENVDHATAASAFDVANTKRIVECRRRCRCHGMATLMRCSMHAMRPAAA